MALLNNKPRLATIMCDEDCGFGVLDKDNFNRILKLQAELDYQKEIKYLGSLPLFQNWDEKNLRKIYLNGVKLQFGRSQKVYQVNDIADSMYIVLEGEFQLSKIVKQCDLKEQNSQDESKNGQLINTQKGKEIVLSNLVPFEMIGIEDMINYTLKIEQFEQQKKLANQQKKAQTSKVSKSVQQQQQQQQQQLLQQQQQSILIRRDQNVKCISFKGQLLQIKKIDFRNIVWSDKDTKTYLMQKFDLKIEVNLKREQTFIQLNQDKSNVLRQIQIEQQLQQQQDQSNLTEQEREEIRMRSNFMSRLKCEPLALVFYKSLLREFKHKFQSNNIDELTQHIKKVGMIQKIPALDEQILEKLSDKYQPKRDISLSSVQMNSTKPEKFDKSERIQPDSTLLSPSLQYKKKILQQTMHTGQYKQQYFSQLKQFLQEQASNESNNTYFNGLGLPKIRNKSQSEYIDEFKDDSPTMRQQKQQQQATIMETGRKKMHASKFYIPKSQSNGNLLEKEKLNKSKERLCIFEEIESNQNRNDEKQRNTQSLFQGQPTQKLNLQNQKFQTMGQFFNQESIPTSPNISNLGTINNSLSQNAQNQGEKPRMKQFDFLIPLTAQNEYQNTQSLVSPSSKSSFSNNYRSFLDYQIRQPASKFKSNQGHKSSTNSFQFKR